MGAVATLTVEEFLAVDIEGDRPAQLVEGEIVVNQPKGIHAVLQARVTYALHAWTQGGDNRGLALSTTGVQMDDYNFYGPDVLWFSAEHVPQDLDAYPEPVPDLCVEIRSESTWRYDIGAKKRVYERGRLPELWLVDDKAETILVYRRSTHNSATYDIALELGRGETLTSPQLPDFELALDELFERPS